MRTQLNPKKLSLTPFTGAKKSSNSREKADRSQHLRFKHNIRKRSPGQSYTYIHIYELEQYKSPEKAKHIPILF